MVGRASRMWQSLEMSAWHRCGVEGTEANVASRWFGVRGEYESLDPARKIWAVLKYIAITMATFGMAGDVDPKRRGMVVLYRRDNGRVVLNYEYDHVSEVEIHALSLASRLPSTHVFDLCRELGLSMNHVVGAGTDKPPEPILWLEVDPTVRWASLPPRQPPW